MNGCNNAPGGLAHPDWRRYDLREQLHPRTAFGCAGVCFVAAAALGLWLVGGLVGWW